MYRQCGLYIHTYTLTCVWDMGFIYGAICCISFIHTHICVYVCTYVCMYVCMYVQSTLPVQIETTGSIHTVGSYCIILTVLCDIPMYNIVWAMLTVWNNWFLK